MTCIVAVKGKDGKVAIAGDRGASDSSTIVNLANPKIFNVNGFFIGYAGSLAGDKLKYVFHPTRPRPDADLDRFMATTFLSQLKVAYDEANIQYNNPDSDLALIVVYDGNIYKHSTSDMSICRIEDDYDALGSGEEYALGSLWSTESVKSAKKRAELAVGAAIQYSPSCAGKVDVLIAE